MFYAWGPSERRRPHRVQDCAGHLKSFSLWSRSHLEQARLCRIVSTTHFLRSLHFESTDWRVISFASKVNSWVAEWHSRIFKVRPRARGMIITQMYGSFWTRAVRGFTQSLLLWLGPQKERDVTVLSCDTPSPTLLGWPRIRVPPSEIRRGKVQGEWKQSSFGFKDHRLIN